MMQSARRHALHAPTRSAALVAALLCVPAARSFAQRAVPTLDAGGSHVRYADSVTASAATLSPALRVDWDRATFGAAGTLSQFAGGWSSQGALALSVYTPAAGALLGELSGSTGGSVHQDGTRTGQSLLVARAHAMLDDRGVWGGAGAGVTWDGGVWRNVRLAELGAWSYAGPATLLATLTPTRVADTLRYTDMEVAARWELSRAEIGLAAGVRAGDRLPTLGGSAMSWGSVSATAWLTPRVAVVASGGSYPVDFTQGFPGGRFVTLGLRFGMRTPSRADRRARASAASALDERATEPPTAGVTAFRVAAAGGGRRIIRVHAPAAGTVELMGDMTDWQPARLARAGGGWWTITLPLAPGTYEVNLRVDGGPWLVPPGLASVTDEFGGAVGVLAVP